MLSYIDRQVSIITISAGGAAFQDFIGFLFLSFLQLILTGFSFYLWGHKVILIKGFYTIRLAARYMAVSLGTKGWLLINRK